MSFNITNSIELERLLNNWLKKPNKNKHVLNPVPTERLLMKMMLGELCGFKENFV